MEKEIRKLVDEIKNVISNDPDTGLDDQLKLIEMVDCFNFMVELVCDRVDNLGSRT